MNNSIASCLLATSSKPIVHTSCQAFCTYPSQILSSPVTSPARICSSKMVRTPFLLRLHHLSSFNLQKHNPTKISRAFCVASASTSSPLNDLKVSPTEQAVVRNADKDAVAVIIGASRGIGLAVTQALVTRWKGRIVATCRNVEEAGALSALWQFMPDRFTVLPMDVCDEPSVCRSFFSFHSFIYCFPY